jgi:hypothetical protein
MDSMNKKKSVLVRITNIFTLLNLIIILGIGCAVMIGLYFIQFHNGLSIDHTKWASFGSYLGSITGTLAFLIVFYSAKQSETRAKKAEAETEKREDIDLFFRALELYHRQVDSVFSGTLKGLEAFKTYGEKANNYLTLYVAIKRIIDNDLKPFSDNNENIKAAQLRKLLLSGVGSDRDRDIPERVSMYRKLLENGEIRTLENYTNSSSEYFNYIKKNISQKEQYLAMRYVGDVIYKEYGDSLGQYFKNINYLVKIILDFKNNERYIEIFRAQLSRYELLILLYYTVSSEADSRDIHRLDKTDIFYNMFPEDIPFFDYPTKKKWDIKYFIEELFSTRLYVRIEEYKEFISSQEQNS